MTTIFPVDPDEHFADHLGEEVTREWARRHRLKWLALWWRERRRKKRIRAGLMEDRPVQPHPELAFQLDQSESHEAYIRWLQHTRAIRLAAMRKAIHRSEAKLRQEREVWRERGVSTAELKRLRKVEAANRRWGRIAGWVVEAGSHLTPLLRAQWEMNHGLLAAPSHPQVLLSVRWLPPPDDGEEECCVFGHEPLVPMELLVLRREAGGRLALMSRRQVEPREAQRLWHHRRQLGWRLVRQRG